MDKIKLRFLKCRLDDIDCEFADLGLVALDPAAGKALADETPVPGVVRWVIVRRASVCSASISSSRMPCAEVKVSTSRLTAIASS